MRVLYVDPGIRGVGAAVFETLNNKLLKAAYVKNPKHEGNGPEECLAMACGVRSWLRDKNLIAALGRIVVEWPRVYVAGKLAGDPNDLLGLVGVDCAIAGVFELPVKRYYPDEWKGQTPKATMNARVSERLTKEERERIAAPPYLLHNVLDAIGIGLHDLGRLSRRRVLPGEDE